MTVAQLKLLSTEKSFSCSIHRFSHTSPTLSNLSANFSIILPASTEPAHLVYYLSGLTCTDQNVILKGHATPWCSKYNVALVVPDTSPRGAGAPHEDESWDFGTGAGFWLNATQKGYEAYQMEDYLIKELPEVAKEAFEVVNGNVNMTQRSIFGHSMGGMGALNMMLRYEGLFKSVSAFSPISNPTGVPWGQKCFKGYLGDDEMYWKEYDPSLLMKKHGKAVCEKIVVDVGADDEFAAQLRVVELRKSCEEVGQKLDLNVAAGYSHSYFFVHTFMEKHIKFHSEQLGGK